MIFWQKDSKREDSKVERTPQTQDLRTARPIEITLPAITKKNALIELAVLFSALYLPDLIKMFVLGRNTKKLYQPLGTEQYLSIFSSGLIAVIMIAFICYKDNRSLKSVGLHLKRLWGEILTAVVVLTSILALFMFASYMLQFFLDAGQLRDLSSKNQHLATIFRSIPWAILVPFCLFIGFYEELVFRGFLITRLTAVLNSKWLALLLSSVIFGLAHLYQGTFSVLIIIVLAIILGTLFIVRKSLISAIIVHASFDLFFLTMIKLQH